MNPLIPHGILKLLLVPILLLRGVLPCQADDVEANVIHFSCDSGSFSVDELPHGKNFALHVHVKEDVTSLAVDYWKISGASCNHKPEKGVESRVGRPIAAEGDDTGKVFSVYLNKLKFDSAYCFEVHWDAERDLEEFKKQIAPKLNKLVEAVADNPNIDMNEGIIKPLVEMITDSATGFPNQGTVEVTIQDRLAGRPQTHRGKRDKVVQDIQDYIKKETTRSFNGLKKTAEILKDYGSTVRSLESKKDQLVQLCSSSSQVVSSSDVGNEDDLAAITEETISVQRKADAWNALSELRPGPQEIPGSVEELETALKNLMSLSEVFQESYCKADDTSRPKDVCDWVKKTRKFALYTSAGIERWRGSRERYRLGIDGFHDDVAGIVQSVSWIVPSAGSIGTDLPSYTERAAWYFSLDMGVVMPFFTTWGPISAKSVDIAMYTGFNLYFTAVDKDDPLSNQGNFYVTLPQRFSISAGMTLDGIRDPEGSVSGIIGDKALLAGFGLRITDYLRVNSGAIFFRQANRNPVSGKKHLRLAPYLAFSIDMDVVGTIKDFFTKN